MSKQLSKDLAPASDVVSHNVTPIEVNTDAGAYSKFGWLIILLGFGGFLLWATLAPLDKGVPMSGFVISETNRKSVQHPTGGVIADILVKDGDVVKKGQLLVRMNSIQASTAAETSRAQYITSRLNEARLLAERDGAKDIRFPPALESLKDDPRAVAGFAVQKELFASRRASIQSDLAAYEENIAGLKLQIRGTEESRDAKKAQAAILKEQLDNVRELAKEGYVARTRLLDLERTYVQVNGAISEDVGNLGRSQRQVAELTLRRLQRSQDYQKEVRTTLSDTQREAEALAPRVEGQEYDVANTEVRSPADGVVVGMAVFTKGGVVGSGAKMMDIVPAHDALVVEGQLPVNLIDRVHVGLPVELVFSAFNTAKTPHIAGTVIQVSADRSVEERTGAPYYKVRARVSPAGAKEIADKKLVVQSGMPVELFVKTGERSLMSYLMKPLLDRAKMSLSED